MITGMFFLGLLLVCALIAVFCMTFDFNADEYAVITGIMMLIYIFCWIIGLSVVNCEESHQTLPAAEPQPSKNIQINTKNEIDNSDITYQFDSLGNKTKIIINLK